MGGTSARASPARLHAHFKLNSLHTLNCTQQSRTLNTHPPHQVHANAAGFPTLAACTCIMAIHCCLTLAANIARPWPQLIRLADGHTSFLQPQQLCSCSHTSHPPGTAPTRAQKCTALCVPCHHHPTRGPSCCTRTLKMAVNGRARARACAKKPSLRTQRSHTKRHALPTSARAPHQPAPPQRQRTRGQRPPLPQASSIDCCCWLPPGFDASAPTPA